MIAARPFTCPSGARLAATEIGFGGAAVGNQFQVLPEEQVTATFQAAWDAGMRVFDTAPHYGLGLSEMRTGRFLATRNPGDYLVSTKIGRILVDCPPEEATPAEFVGTPSKRRVWDYSHDGVMRSFEASLERTGLERIDILLCHDLDAQSIGSQEEYERCAADFRATGYKAMASLRAQGVVRAIGAGLNWWQLAEDMAQEYDMDMFLLAGRYTLLEQDSLESFLPLCQRRGIGILLGGPYNSGILATGARPGAIYQYAPASAEILERVGKIERVCAAHGVSLAAAALRFPLAHPSVVSVIPGAKSPQEVAMNVATLNVAIPAGLWSDLRAEGLLRADAPVPA